MGGATAPPAGPAGNENLLDVLEDLLALMVVLVEPAHHLDRRHQVNWTHGFPQPGLKELNPLVSSRRLVSAGYRLFRHSRTRARSLW